MDAAWESVGCYEMLITDLQSIRDSLKKKKSLVSQESLSSNSLTFFPCISDDFHQSTTTLVSSSVMQTSFLMMLVPQKLPSVAAFGCFWMAVVKIQCCCCSGVSSKPNPGAFFWDGSREGMLL